MNEAKGQDVRNSNIVCYADLQEVALVQVRVRPRDVVDLSDDPVHGAVCDDHDAGRVQGDGEVREELNSVTGLSARPYVNERFSMIINSSYMSLYNN